MARPSLPVRMRTRASQGGFLWCICTPPSLWGCPLYMCGAADRGGGAGIYGFKGGTYGPKNKGEVHSLLLRACGRLQVRIDQLTPPSPTRCPPPGLQWQFRGPPPILTGFELTGRICSCPSRYETPRSCIYPVSPCTVWSFTVCVCGYFCSCPSRYEPARSPCTPSPDAAPPWPDSSH